MGLRLAVLRCAGAPLLISGQGGLFMFLLCEEFYFPSIDDQHWFFSCVPVLKLYPHFIYSASIQEGLQEESEDNLRKMTLLDQQRGLFRVLLPMRVDRLLLLISFMFTLYWLFCKVYTIGGAVALWLVCSPRSSLEPLLLVYTVPFTFCVSPWTYPGKRRLTEKSYVRLCIAILSSSCLNFSCLLCFRSELGNACLQFV